VLLLVLGSIATFAGSFAWWLDRQALSPSGWQTTSSQLIGDRHVRSAVGTFAVDELFRQTGASRLLHSALPSAAADALDGRLRALGRQLAFEILSSRQARAVWNAANRQAHRDLLRILDTGGRRGEIALNLTPLLRQLVRALDDSAPLQQFPASDREQLFALSGSAPGQLPILSARQVDHARAAVNLLRGLSIGLAIAAVVFLAGAVALAHGWRARALMLVGVCLILVGVVVFAVRSVLAPALADALVSSSTYRPAARAAWAISTTELRTTAIAIAAIGAAGILLGAGARGATATARRT
jgi:hypothetical protein